VFQIVYTQKLGFSELKFNYY